MKRILIAEDDPTIRSVTKDFISSNNYLVDDVEDGALALEYVKKQQPDLVILDLSLPKMTGESVCKEIKRLYPLLPIIILTAKNHSDDVINGFRLGADDYMSKPFELEELMARIHARLKDGKQEVLRADDLVLDPQTVTVSRGEKEIPLSLHEFKLLEYLLTNKGKVLTREMILNKVWDYSYDIYSRVVDVYIGYLRKKIDEQSDKKLITSVRGFGYTIKE